MLSLLVWFSSNGWLHILIAIWRCYLPITQKKSRNGSSPSSYSGGRASSVSESYSSKLLKSSVPDNTGTIGASNFRARRLSKSKSVNHLWVLISEAPFFKQPYLLVRSAVRILFVKESEFADRFAWGLRRGRGDRQQASHRSKYLTSTNLHLSHDLCSTKLQEQCTQVFRKVCKSWNPPYQSS